MATTGSLHPLGAKQPAAQAFPVTQRQRRTSAASMFSPSMRLLNFLIATISPDSRLRHLSTCSKQGFEPPPRT